MLSWFVAVISHVASQRRLKEMLLLTEIVLERSVSVRRTLAEERSM